MKSMRTSTVVLAAMFAAVRAGAQQPAPPPASQPLSLSSATSVVFQQVSAFQQAQLDEAIAAEDLRQARAALLPRFRDNYTVTYNSHEPGNVSTPSFIGANAIHEYQNLLGVEGTFGFGLLSAVRRSRALLEAARAGTEVARRDLRRAVAEAYYGAALATAKREAAELSLAAAEEFERNTALNERAGEVPEVDVIRARLQTAARRDELLQAQQQEAVARAALGTLLGLAIDHPPLIEPLPQSVDVHALDSYTAAAVAMRPELRQVEAELRAARADVSVARGDLLPHITYSVDHGFDSDSLRPEVVRIHRGILAMASIDFTIFDWAAGFSKQRQAQLKARSAELQRNLMTRDLQLQFLTARTEASSAVERIANARAALDLAERNVAISVARYRAGEGPISEATDAQTALAQQRLALQQALYDFQVASAHLREAAGE